MSNSKRHNRNQGARNPDGTWMAGMERGPYKPFPLPVGHKQGEFTILRWESKGAGWNPVVRCSCGWEGTVNRSNFLGGRSTRCNTCAKQKSAKTNKHYWGYEDIVPDHDHRVRLLNRISAILARCNPANRNKGYALRGIEVYPPWREDRKAFLKYLVSLDGWENPELEIDRINNEGDYEPGNLRFTTRSTQQQNIRKVGVLQDKIEDLRHRLRRAEEQIHCDDGLWADYGA